MRGKQPFLAIAVVVATAMFALSPLMTSEFEGYRPDHFPVVQEFWPVQPAGWAFGIWGVIYAWLFCGALWGLLNAPWDVNWQRMRTPLLVSLCLGVFWITAANADPILATFMIFVMAATAVSAMLRAGEDAPVWQVRPVALYAGWLTAATGVGTGVVLGGYGVLGAQAAAMMMLAAVLLVALLVQSLRPAEWAYPLAVIWALAGVIAANAPFRNLPIILLSAAGIAALCLGFALHRSLRSTRD